MVDSNRTSVTIQSDGGTGGGGGTRTNENEKNGNHHETETEGRGKTRIAVTVGRFFQLPRKPSLSVAANGCCGFTSRSASINCNK